MNATTIKKLALTELNSSLSYSNYAIGHNNTYNNGRNNEHYSEYAKVLEKTIDTFKQKVDKTFITVFIKQFKPEILTSLKDADISHCILSLHNYIDFDKGTIDFKRVKENNRLSKEQLDYFNL